MIQTFELKLTREQYLEICLCVKREWRNQTGFGKNAELSEIYTPIMAELDKALQASDLQALYNRP